MTMPHSLVTVQGPYAVWSTVVDAPLTPFVSIIDDLRAVAPPCEDLGSARLTRLERYGSSVLHMEPGGEVVAFNHRGPNEACLSITELLHAYGHTNALMDEDDSSHQEGR